MRCDVMRLDAMRELARAKALPQSLEYRFVRVGSTGFASLYLPRHPPSSFGSFNTFMAQAPNWLLALPPPGCGLLWLSTGFASLWLWLALVVD